MERKIELIQKIIALVIKLNADTKTDAFFDYSGHVDKFEVKISPEGWTKDVGIRYAYWGSFDNVSKLEEILEALELVVMKEVA